MNAHPRRIPDDEPEAASRRDVGKVNGKGEWERAAGDHATSMCANVCGLTAQGECGGAFRFRWPVALAEEIAASPRANEIAPPRHETRQFVVERGDGTSPLLAFECASERIFAHAGCARIALSQMRHRVGAAWRDIALAERAPG
jgi:hypothetical protein